MAYINKTLDRPCLPFRGVQNDGSAYLPLDPQSQEIRVLRLHPGLPDEPVVCSLGYTTLDPVAQNRISYQALSYCWGNIDDTVTISLYCPSSKAVFSRTLGKLHTKHNFRITRNLEITLRSLRLMSKSLVLWVDAICMNQGDPREKTHQVGLMSLVYSSAEEVLVCLGELDWASRVVVRCHELLQKSIDACVEAFQYQPRRDLPEYVARLQRRDHAHLRLHFLRSLITDTHLQRFFRHSGLKKDLEQSHGFTELPQKSVHTSGGVEFMFRGSVDRVLSRPYFRRIWVYQEVLLAPQNSDGHRKVTVRVGRASLRWGDMVNIVRFSSQFQKQHPQNHPTSVLETLQFPSTSWFEDAWSHMGRLTRVSFEKYYTRTRGFVATDPRDKFYALLHLGVNTRSAVRSNPLLSPNYEIPLECLILNFFRAGIDLPLHIRIDYGKILSDPCVSDRGNNSWEPFAFGVWHDVEAVNLRKTNNYKAEPLDLADLTPGQGYEVAKVGRTIWISRDRAFGSWNDKSTNETLCDQLSDLLDTCRAYVMGLRNETFYHNVLRMIGVSEERISAELSEFQDVLTFCTSSRFTELITLNKALIEDLQRLWSQFPRPSLCLSNYGRLMLTHVPVKCGDLVAIFPGCSGPMVLTPARLQTNAYTWQTGPDYKVVGGCSLYPAGEPSRAAETIYEG